MTGKERELLIVLFSADPAPWTLREWASVAFCSPSTIRYRFRGRLIPAGITPRLVLNLNRLLAGIEDGNVRATWGSLAVAAEVDQRRLKRLAKTLDPRRVGYVPDAPALSGGFLRLLRHNLSF